MILQKHESHMRLLLLQPGFVVVVAADPQVNLTVRYKALHRSPEQQQEINSQGSLLPVKLSSAGRQMMKATDRKYL